jgi:hypothetical protein
VFALASIAKGTPVWHFTPGFDLDLDPAMLDGLAPDQRAVMLHYGYIDPRLQRFILCADNTRFMNHSNSPNLAPDFTLEPHGVDIAVRDIAAGEELTVDYAFVDGTTC